MGRNEERASTDRRRVRAFPALFLIVTMVVPMGGCTSPVSSTRSEKSLVADGAFDLVREVAVPEVRGAEGCGAQALATAMAWEDRSLQASVVAAELPWHDEGATPVDLLLEARRRGFDAEIARGSWAALQHRASEGKLTLVMIDASPEVRTLTARIPTIRVMHWAVVSGVAKDDSRLLLATTHRRHHVVERGDFLRRWEKSARCMIVVEREQPST